jgi:hypothetical protein
MRKFIRKEKPVLQQTPCSTLLEYLAQKRISDYEAACRAETQPEYRELMDNVNAINHVLKLIEAMPPVA